MCWNNKKELRKELLEQYAATKGNNLLFSEHSFIPFLKHIKKHKYFYRITLQIRKTFPIEEGYEQLWAIFEPLCQNAGITREEDILYYFVYFQAGFTMILKRWVDQDCQEEEEQIAKIINNCLPAILAK